VDERPLADDDEFLARLADLDNGLESNATPATGSSKPFAATDSSFDDLTVPTAEDLELPPDAPRRDRPLLQLFPVIAAQPGKQVPSAPIPQPRPPMRRDVEPVAPDPVDAFYGLTEKAFSSSPDPRFFFHSIPHDAVVQQLLTAIRRREGLVALTGIDGIGKSTTCRVVLEQIDRRTLTSLLSESTDTPEQLLARILSDFGVLSPPEAHGPRHTLAELRSALQSFVESLGPLDASAVIFVDDAPRLPPAVFSEVRKLCETAHVESLLQVILVGDESLLELLRRKENRALQHRIAVRTSLAALRREEIGDYIAHRLAVAGNARVEFDEDALDRVFDLSGGVPLAINRLCDAALASGRNSAAGVVTATLVDEAADTLGLAGAGSAAAKALYVAIVGVIVVAFLLVGAAAAAWVFRDFVARAVTTWEEIPTPPTAPRRLPPPLAVPPIPAESRDRPL
jgi:general secretion pathway protein A